MNELHYVETEPQTVRLAEQGAQARPSIEQTILREGTWKHPGAPGGVLDVNKVMLDELQRNFEAGIGLGGDKVPFHFGHTEDKDESSAAWGKVSVVPDPQRPGKHKMVAQATFTSDQAAQDVLGGKYAFTSPTLLFGYTDKESGQKHDTVLRNVAFTNYPYLQKMGRASVLNLSEVTTALQLSGNTVPGFGAGGPAGGEPNLDGLPSGYDTTELPTECQTCAKLGNDCPFAAKDADGDLKLKQAAAGSGNCPQYVEADSQVPGGGGPADAASASPAAGRKAGAAQLSETARSSERPASRTQGPSKGPSKMKQEQIARLVAQAQQAEADKQKEFMTQLSETHKLPAATLKVVEDAMKSGSALSVQLSEALDGADGAFVQLSENPDKASEVTRPKALDALPATLELSECVTLPRSALRDLLSQVATAERTGEVQLSDTKPVEGKAGDKKEKTTAEKVQEEQDPDKALKLLRDSGE